MHPRTNKINYRTGTDSARHIKICRVGQAVSHKLYQLTIESSNMRVSERLPILRQQALIFLANTTPI